MKETVREESGFTLLQTYKVLKPKLLLTAFYVVLHSYKLTRFSNNKKFNLHILIVLHSYKLTRFSNKYGRKDVNTEVLHSYKLTRFSNKQVLCCVNAACFTLLQTYKVLKPRTHSILLS